mmetsp:Transcript_31360/g.55135  ORF Transcript_31360/g.55135 Transcript_31360/m.55135 type:complete len:106 (+) Transcript_31360:53-370(+)
MDDGPRSAELNSSKPKSVDEEFSGITSSVIVVETAVNEAEEEDSCLLLDIFETATSPTPMIIMTTPAIVIPFKGSLKTRNSHKYANKTSDDLNRADGPAGAKRAP